MTNGTMAVASNSFFTFTLSANAGNVLNLATLEFDVAKGGTTTPRGFVIQSSVDGFAANLAGPTDIPTTRPTFTHYTIDLSGASFQGLFSITFRLFTYSPSVGSTVEYDNLTVNGSLGAVSLTPVFNLFQLTRTNLVISGTNGATNGVYYVLSATNASLPLNQWTPEATNAFDSQGAFAFTNTLTPAVPQKFFRLRVP